MEKPSRGGQKRTDVWASHHEERWSDGVVAPPECALRVVPHRWVVLERRNPSESAADACVVSIPQALHGAPRAPLIHAQRVARFDHYHAHNGLPSQQLRREIQ